MELPVSDETKKNLTEKNTWMRGVYMLLFIVVDIFFVRGGFFLPRGGRGVFAAPPRDPSGHRRLGGVFLRVAALVVVLDGAAAEIRLVRKSIKRFGV